MEPLYRLLTDDLNGLLDRITAAWRESGAPAALAPDQGLRMLMDEAEERLSGLRLRVLQDYEEWRCAMDACEGLWALSRLRAGGEAEPMEPAEIEVLEAA